MDVTRRGRRLFWLLAAAMLALTLVPSLALVDAARDYWRFLTGWQPGTLKRTTVSIVPRHDRLDGNMPDIRFVEFSFKAPAAKSVTLPASFNGFDPRALALTRGKDGVWSTLVPLAPGRYEYAFDVDGKWTTDPGAPAAVSGARSVSVRSVR